jgi:hypothetical protein
MIPSLVGCLKPKSEKIISISATRSFLSVHTDSRVLYSTNSGASFNQFELPVENILKVIMCDTTTFFAATTSAIYYSTNSGVSWTSSNSPIIIVDLCVSGYESVQVISASARRYFYISTGWSNSMYVPSSGLVRVSGGDNTTADVWVTTPSTPYYIDDGFFTSSITGTSPANDIIALEADYYGNYLYVLTPSIIKYSTADSLDSWTSWNLPINGAIGISIGYSNKNLFYIATTNKLYKATSKGGSWALVSLPI